MSPELSRYVTSTLAEARAALAAAQRTSDAAAAALREAEAHLARAGKAAACPDCSAAEDAVNHAKNMLALAQTAQAAAVITLGVALADALVACAGTGWIPVLGWAVCLAAGAVVLAATAAVAIWNRNVIDATDALDQANKALEACRNQGKARASCGDVSGVSGVAWRRPLRARIVPSVVLA